jgi:hypothetical protein
MHRRVIWLQLLIGWLPLWAVFALLIHVAHHASLIGASHIAFRMVVSAAALGFFVLRFAERHPWPVRVTPTFALLHVVAAIVYSISWNLLNSAIESAVRGQLVLVVGIGIASSVMMGMWLYIMIAGVSYTTIATERAAKAEANAAKAQLAALRSQVNPHFLFNALHTVVQLIPKQPKDASDAAEKLAGLLRTSIEEHRDVVPVSEEAAFVTRYLELERIRFGDRLQVRMSVRDDTLGATVPSFALQTLVENAVRHGAAPRVEPTTIYIDTSLSNGRLTAIVRDTGSGTIPTETSGTGLKRLRERLTVLYRGEASLEVHSTGDGVIATLTVPQSSDYSSNSSNSDE